jgi:hypothetical protein
MTPPQVTSYDPGCEKTSMVFSHACVKIHILAVKYSKPDTT